MACLWCVRFSIGGRACSGNSQTDIIFASLLNQITAQFTGTIQPAQIIVKIFNLLISGKTQKKLCFESIMDLCTHMNLVSGEI